MTSLPLTLDQLHRDLLWIANSPVMLNLNYLPAGYWLTSPLHQYAQFAVDQYDLKKVTDCLASRKSHLLGIYYETLWHYLLAAKLNCKLQTTNLQVKSNQGTLGEFDLIYQASSSEQPFHRELAVKYYLGLPCDSSEAHSPWSYWVGPGLKDRLDLKVNKLINKQGRLSQSIEGQALLQQHQLFPVTAEILLQGYLFYPFAAHCPAPQHACIDHLTGYWLTTSQLAEFIEHNQLTDEFVLLAKHEWLSAFSNTTSAIQHRLFSSAALNHYATQHFTTSAYPYPLLIASGSSNHQFWQETLRFFLVPDDWLEKAKKTIP
ncbi:DUF1853 family protein [Endozoicomonas sp. SM1973]|uniref:DUF1853 family protein n=1 Tax=Spartinivicinus marinus TaxID=2994442 RepID=A0A853IGU8_9GAMM|nr:DUF1853 family protein [Spartinivicinus marinus]MCX4024949.1 DUF1853 family protein [Spartinivicinus marinus]NYZ69231.1 DUF1853 family protein [Spartinivicinus marinus]